MRFLMINHIQNAYQSLRCSRIRSMLTMLGVTIGIASITAILSLSGGASKVVSDQIDLLGGNLAIVRPGESQNTDPIANITQSQNHRDFATSTLTENDLKKIAATKHVKAVAPLMILSGTIKGESTASNKSQILATTDELAEITGLEVRAGQFLTKDATRNNAVVGIQLAIDTFGTESPIGRVMTIRGQKYNIVGVLKRMNNPINYNSIDYDNTAIINFDAGKKLNNDTAQIQQINIQADSIEHLDGIIANIDKLLTDNHQGEKDFSILTGQQISQPTSQLFYAIAGVSSAIAAISLIVGGIGIMNIMLVTVAERTREIGIRKALGANNADISWQFLIESLVISFSGGLAGYIVGYLIAFTVSRTMNLTFMPIINWQIAAVTTVVSLALGTVFGIYPAWRAARKDPIESLQQYN